MSTVPHFVCYSSNTTNYAIVITMMLWYCHNMHPCMHACLISDALITSSSRTYSKTGVQISVSLFSSFWSAALSVDKVFEPQWISVVFRWISQFLCEFLRNSKRRNIFYWHFCHKMHGKTCLFANKWTFTKMGICWINLIKMWLLWGVSSNKCAFCPGQWILFWFHCGSFIIIIFSLYCVFLSSFILVCFFEMSR